jgi:hypothetical protein
MRNTLVAFGLGFILCLFLQGEQAARPVVVPVHAGQSANVPPPERPYASTFPNTFGYQGAALEGVPHRLTPYEFDRMERYLALSRADYTSAAPMTEEQLQYNRLWNRDYRTWNNNHQSAFTPVSFPMP